MPEAERRLRLCWELRALLGNVVPLVGGKACTGWSSRVGGPGVWERLRSVTWLGSGGRTWFPLPGAGGFRGQV